MVKPSRANRYDPDQAHKLGYTEDERGFIEDVVGSNDGVTKILTLKGAIRGNHIHHHTTQWTIVSRGKLLVVTQEAVVVAQNEYGAGMMFRDDPGVPHAWKALETTVCYVITRGPRAGIEYESDVQRLEVPLLR